MRFDKIISIRSLGDILFIVGLCLVCWYQGWVAQIVSHHDRGVKWGEIKSGHRFLVKASGRLYDNSPLILTFITTLAINRDYKVVVFGFPVELGGYFDLLASREQECDGDSSDSGHLSQVEKTHELLHQSEWKISILDTIHSKSSPGELIPRLEFWYHTVMDIFFLLFEEVLWHRVERVRAEFMLSENNLEHVKLNSSFNINVFGVSCSQSFWTQGRQLNFWLWVLESTEFWIVENL